MKNKGNVPVNIKWRFKRFYKSSISARSDYEYGCILTTYGKIKNRLQAENMSISDTTVRPRKDIYSFDYACVNEAVLNPLVHNDWTVTEPQISMFHDRLEIFSHGGLPGGMTKNNSLRVLVNLEMPH
ncbi:ATP-binding protein [Johnsonella ignava]|nr:ATP-binding protein [Johnsonella ignava]